MHVNLRRTHEQSSGPFIEKNNLPPLSEANNGGPDDPDKFNGAEDNDPRRRRRGIAGFVGLVGTAAVVSGVLVLDSFSEKKNNNNTEPGVRPTATAPVTPGETPVTPLETPSASEQAPDTKMVGVPLSELDPVKVASYKAETVHTPEELWYVIDGKVYEGIDNAAEVIQVNTEKYETAEAALSVVVEDRLNDWINSGNTKEENDWYSSYGSPDGQRGGVGAVAEFYDAAYSDALIRDGDPRVLPGSAGSAKSWGEVQTQSHGDTLQQWGVGRAQGDTDATEFKASYSIDSPLNKLIEVDGAASIVAPEVTYKDNAGEGAIGKLRSEPGGYLGIEEKVFKSTARWDTSVAKVKNTDGFETWKIISMKVSEPNETPAN